MTRHRLRRAVPRVERRLRGAGAALTRRARRVDESASRIRSVANAAGDPTHQAREGRLCDVRGPRLCAAGSWRYGDSRGISFPWSHSSRWCSCASRLGPRVLLSVRSSPPEASRRGLVLSRQDSGQPIASATAAQIACKVDCVTVPTHRTMRARGTSWRLSRFTTDGLENPSVAVSSTSVVKPRTVDVTGPTITECNRRPRGSRVRTTTGRRLSSSASQISPRRTVGTFNVPVATQHPSRCRRRGRSSRERRERTRPRRQ